jgi:hypothetical protein
MPSSTRVTLLRAPCLLAALLVLALPSPAWGQAASWGTTAPRPRADHVLTELAARFDPAFVGDRGAHANPDEPCLLPLMQRVAAIAPELSAAQRESLAALDPHLATVLSGADGTQEDSNGLPDIPELTETMEGKQCVVHYTLTGQHAAPDLAFVKILTKTLDGAIKKYAKDFKRPFFEPDRDDLDLLHVFIQDTSTVPDFDDAVLGFVNPTDDVPGEGNEKAQTVYMVIDKDAKQFAAAAGVNWKKQLKATLYHEYFHCVQLAYNAFMASWGLEGQAVWAEKRWGRVDADIYGFLERPDSFVNEPELPIYHDPEDAVRKYSTSPMWAYLEQRVGKDALELFWAGASLSQDPITILENVLILDNFDVFQDFWIDFVGRLVAKDIRGLSKKKLPDVKLQEDVIDFGWETMGQVAKTAILVYKLHAPTDKKTSLLFARVLDTGDGSPSGVLVHDKNKRLELFAGFWDEVEKFKKGKTAHLVVTDGDYEFFTEDTEPFTASAFAPYLKIHSIENDGPTTAGQLVTFTFNYTLLCVPEGPTFNVAIYRKAKGKKYSAELQSIFAWTVGTNQTAEMTHLVPAFPKLKSLAFKINVKTPTDAFGGEHVVSKNKEKVKVVPAGG